MGSLLGSEISFRAAEAVSLSAAEFSSKVRKKSVALLLESASDEGQALVLFRLSDAIMFAATLLMMPPAQVKELVRAGAMDQDTADAFNEVANILYGSVNEIIAERDPTKGKLRNEGIQLVDASKVPDVESIWPSGEPVGAEMTIAMPGQETGTAFIVFQESLLASILGITISEPTGGTLLVYSKNPAVATDLEAFAAEVKLSILVAKTPDEAVAAVADRPAMIIVEFGATDAGASKVCTAAVREGGLPVVGISSNPTKETILAARKAGVKAFLVHPFGAEALRTKVSPLMAS